MRGNRPVPSHRGVSKADPAWRPGKAPLLSLPRIGSSNLFAKAKSASTKQQRVRAFFGLPLPEEQRTELGGYLAECVALAPDFRWVPPANLHLTLRFIGSIERQLVDEIADGLALAAMRAFDLELGELGTFKRGRLVRVVWLGLASEIEPARMLAAQIEAACVRAGLEPENRAFQAHLTLARAKARFGAALPSLAPAPRLRPWRADELILYQSHLSPKGSVYEPLRRLPLTSQ